MGGYIISQDIESCVVAGMPKAVIEQKIANEIVPLNEISESIASIFGIHSKNHSS
jgi:two-component system chemotaxis response regulator CheB